MQWFRIFVLISMNKEKSKWMYRISMDKIWNLQTSNEVKLNLKFAKVLIVC
jgi:hypothetical protein